MSAHGTNCAGNHISYLRCKYVTYLSQIVQGLLGIFVLLSLVYKRHRETPKRPWRIWFVSQVRDIHVALIISPAGSLMYPSK